MQQPVVQLPFRGIIPPVITPLLSQHELDLAGLERLIEHLISGGVHGLFILGTTGEGPGLSYRLRYELVQQVCDQVDNRLPILVGITDTSSEDSIKLAEWAETLGADAVVAAPPYYFKPDQRELQRYFEYLADRIPLPLFLYNMPSHTKVNIEAETVVKLSEHKNFIGLKDSSGDLIYFQKVLQLMEGKPEFFLLTGPEEILVKAILSGGHGGVPGGANIFPALYVQMYNAAKKRDFEKMNELQSITMRIRLRLYTIGNSPGSYLQGVKSALSILGICNDKLALPYQSHSAEQKKKVMQLLNELNEIIST